MSKPRFLIGAIGLALLLAPVAIGAGEGEPLEGGQRNPSPNQTQELQKETEIIANVATYGTRQSNKSNNGGGAIYGCRSKPGGTPAGNEPCIRANNLNTGLAFEFETDGDLAGTIKAGKGGGDDARPFTTNATGVATGLNADRVDSRSAEQLTADAVAAVQATEPFAQVAADGTSPKEPGVVSTKKDGTGDYTVVFEGDRSDCAIASSLIGTDPGMITANAQVAADKKTTTVDVRTFSAGGATTAPAPADSTFHLSLNC